MSDPRGTSRWSVSVSPAVAADAAWRARLLERLRPEVEARLQSTPASREMVFAHSLFEVRAKLVHGAWRPGVELQFSWESGERQSTSTAVVPGLHSLSLPDAASAELGGRLVGLETHIGDITTRLDCAWGQALNRWKERFGMSVAPALCSQLTGPVPLFILRGCPGTGKSALARSVADAWVRKRGGVGDLNYLDTRVRGTGLVGEFGSRVRTAFEAVVTRSSLRPQFLIIEEADAVAARRDGVMHQEDRSGTSTLLQALDGAAGSQVAVFLTTNLAGQLDPALRRRGVERTFTRPDTQTRKRIIESRLPGQSEASLRKAAEASRGMTPADIDRALARALLGAVQAETPLLFDSLVRALRDGERTGSFDQ